MNTKPLPETYAGAITELESIVRKMQSDDCDIDSLAAYTARIFIILYRLYTFVSRGYRRKCGAGI